MTAVGHPAADRAAAYGLEATVVDGNDADAVYLAAQAAIERARAGGGPSLIETKTYRHGGHSRADPGTYRPAEEVEAWLAHDPIPMYHQRLLRLGVGEERLTEIVTSVAAAIDAATEAGQGGGAAGSGRVVDQRVGRRGVAVAQLTYREAVARGIAQEMRRDPTVVFLGEDVAGAGGVFKTTAGLLDEFGPGTCPSTHRSPNRRSSAQRWGRR